MAPRPITFLSDYGEADEFAGACRAVIARIAPEALVIDITHGIPGGDVRRGALALEAALPHAAPGVHLAVVDPGVGGERRAVAVRVAAQDRVLVGPDNGLLWPAIQKLGGVTDAVEISASSFRAERVAPTFHGRDLFAPVAAHLALGASLREAGRELDPAILVALELPSPTLAPGEARGHVLYADSFGNLTLDLRRSDLSGLGGGHDLLVECAGREHQTLLGSTFSDVPEGELVLYEDSTGRLALAVRDGSAEALLGAGRDERIRVSAR
jgi:S-adenosyl-L-methionine hydrolase (adenosine-forming)